MKLSIILTVEDLTLLSQLRAPYVGQTHSYAPKINTNTVPLFAY